jgi:hypothetical protein
MMIGEKRIKTEKVMAEDLLNRFRSKEDLYRYLTQHGKHLSPLSLWLLVGVFLPSMGATKLSFMRDILSERKSHLKITEVFKMEIPAYPEISVTNLYDDAMADPVLSKHLPTKEQLSGKLPERDFFFGIVCTLKKGYMEEVIKCAHEKRFKLNDQEEEKSGILISESWMQELMKHPYHSSKFWLLICVEKAGTGIFLMKEKSKLYKPRKAQIKHVLSKRLSQMNPSNQDGSLAEETSTKRKNLGDGKYEIIQTGSQQQIAANKK